MNAFANHFAFEFRTGLRNPTLLLMNYLFPLGFYAMMGLVMTQINPLFVGVIIPAMVIVAIMASNLLGLPGPLVESREAGIYRSFKINGVPALAIVATPMLTTVFHALIVSAIIALTAPLFFGGEPPSNWGAFILVTLVSALTFGAIGALIGVVAKEERATVFLSQAIFLPSMLLSGLMMPLSMLPAAVTRFAALLPATHAMQAFAGLAFSQETVFDPGLSLLILASSGALAFLLAVYLFSWDSRNATRRGHPLLGLLALMPYVIAFLRG